MALLTYFLVFGGSPIIEGNPANVIDLLIQPYTAMKTLLRWSRLKQLISLKCRYDFWSIGDLHGESVP